MITRIVKMSFQDGRQQAFEKIFYRTRPAILLFEGCNQVELQRDAKNPAIYFTISRWDSESALENYRSSTLFRNTWSEVKPLFAERAEAWSLESVSSIPD